MSLLDIKIQPNHQIIGAKLSLALLDGDPHRVNQWLTRAAIAGPDAALAILAVQTRNLVAALTLLQGGDDTRAALERTITDLELEPDDEQDQMPRPIERTE